jgi:hypothetical protein
MIAALPELTSTRVAITHQTGDAEFQKIRDAYNAADAGGGCGSLHLRYGHAVRERRFDNLPSRCHDMRNWRCKPASINGPLPTVPLTIISGRMPKR